MKLEAHADNTRALSWLRGIGDRLDNPRGLLDVLVDEVHDYEADVFSTAGNGTWAALAEGTLRQKTGSTILQEFGSLLDALTSSSDFTGEDLVVDADGVAHAGYHRSGTSRMPRRDPTPEPPPGVTERWAETLLDEIVGRS